MTYNVKSVKYVKNLENNGKKHATVYDVIFLFHTLDLIITRRLVEMSFKFFTVIFYH